MEDRPALVCGALLSALDASDGRRRRRKRDTTPDAIGMSLKRSLLAEAVEADPDPDVFEAWLLECCFSRSRDASIGALRAMAREVIAEWRLAGTSAAFRAWLAAGAPSDDHPDENGERRLRPVVQNVVPSTRSNDSTATR